MLTPHPKELHAQALDPALARRAGRRRRVRRRLRHPRLRRGKRGRGLLFANNALLAPDGGPKSVTLYAFTESFPEDLTVTVDRGTVNDFADVSLTHTRADCTETASSITCDLKGGEVIDFLLDLTVEAKDSAGAGDTGELTFTVDAKGEESVRTTATVEIGEGIDLTAQESFAFSGAPGTSKKAPLGVSNVGKTTARDAVLFLAMTPGLAPAERHSNCSYLFALGTQFAQCTVGEIAPGAVLQLDDSSALKIVDDAWAPGEQYGTAVWFGSGDWSEFLTEFPIPTEEWQKGSGDALELVSAVMTTAARGLKQVDTDPSNNITEILATVKGDQHADAAATGAEVAGSVGETVTAKVGFVNNGPAMINTYLPGELTTTAEVTIPAGATAVAAPESCAPVNGDDIGGFGEPGGRVYFCEWFDVLRKGEAALLEFGLRIDKLSGAAGSVELLHFDFGDDDSRVADLNPNNDVAPFALKGAAGGQGGGDGDGPTLPITGANAGLIAGIGGVLLAAGAAGFVVARRRKTRFVA
ncbi:LPXTG cell wall anchor domain-containing protein [Micromonospora sp. WMMA1363]|uniref:LPXTG cell wall anchor domain-containing protein n=1 Tax=Micromonospora sp. WMMA1363 TaxID=3053985 RepID=UPI00259CA834|nr:LPXTG cell wall anchor domain-containing protein [Micromonospora sp. WMMA1363]MDM4721571.1 LPXTG cell wall anchor domain-containing protein [Micromonospora sp. WMMA1363]